MAGSFPHDSSSSATPPIPRSRIADTAQAGDLGPLIDFYTQSAPIDPAGHRTVDVSADAGGASMEMDAVQDGSASRAWREGLPTCSRGFEQIVRPPATSDAAEGDEEAKFFAPSYLEGSTYIRKLEWAHRSRSIVQEATANGTLRHLTTFPQPPPSGSHRGLSHTVTERLPIDDNETLPPLPTKWNDEDKLGGIEIQENGLVVKYTGSKNQSEREREHEACAVRADHYMPALGGLYYFEVEILSAKREDAKIGIGFSTKTATLSRPMGWEPEAWGYHGDDGRCFTGQNIGRHFGPRYNKDDVIGCGINFRDRTAFFTKNGVKLGTAFHEIARGKNYFPAVSLKQPGECIRANFGHTPFVYNIDDMVREEREKAHKAIQDTDTSTLVNGMGETDLIQALVLQFLQHDGYVETARAFAEDMRLQKETLNLDPSVPVAGVNIRDDEDANNRQRIRIAILEGDIDRGLKLTNAYYPHVLRDNERVYFRLRCRRFIEMVRKAAQMNMMYDMRRDGRSEKLPEDIDMDMNGSGDFTWGDSDDVPPELVELESDMLEYGQTLQAEFANDPRKEVARALDDIWALVAYRNPLKEPQVSHLLDRTGRVAVAEELNSAILLSLGKSSRAALETLYAQTSVLLETLRQDGSVGAFVAMEDALEGIPRSSQM